MDSSRIARSKGEGYPLRKRHAATPLRLDIRDETGPEPAINELHIKK